MGTSLARSESETDIAVKARSYRMESAAVDGMDIIAVENAVRDATARIRRGAGPVLLELRTYRFRAHSMFDSQLYRDKAEIQAWQQKGPIISFTTRFKAAGLLSEEDYLRLERQARSEVEQAVAFAEASEWEPLCDLERFVYAEQSNER
jgi:TPP-dependent pyruvate/acetoin dehydrogenase alpha subunit